MNAPLNNRRQKAADLMRCLDPSERRVLRLWLVPSSGIHQAINDISTTLNVSRENIRRALNKAKKMAAAQP